MKDGTQPGPPADPPDRDEQPADAAKQSNPLWRFLLTPLGKGAGAVLLAIAGAAGVAIWNYARDEVKGSPPLFVNVQTNPAKWDEPQSNLGALWYVVPRAPSAIGRPPPGLSWDWHAWAHRIGGVDAWVTELQLVFEAGKSDRVLIHGLWPEIVRRRPPLKGTTITAPAGGATPNVDVLDIDLDRGRTGSVDSGSAPSSKRPVLYTLTDADVEVAYVDAYTDKYDVEWRLKLGYVVNGKDYVRTIDDAGKPFRTTARQNTEYTWSEGRWVQYNSGA